MGLDGRYRLADRGQFFATRATARGIREQIEAEPLDLTGVAGMTGAFGDELIGKLACGGWKIIVEGATDELWNTIQTVLLRRDLIPVQRYLQSPPSAGTS